MSEANWIVLLSSALVLFVTLLFPKYLELKIFLKLFNVKLKEFEAKKALDDENSDDIIIVLLQKLSDADLEDMHAFYKKEACRIENVATDDAANKYCDFRERINNYLAMEMTRREEYKKAKAYNEVQIKN